MKSNILDPAGEPAEASTPKSRGDIIACGIYDGSNGQSVCWCDFVSDALLFAISKGAKGWSTTRTDPRELTDSQKQSQLWALQNYVYSKIVLGLAVNGGGAS
jgi:hypothetical protein